MCLFSAFVAGLVLLLSSGLLCSCRRTCLAFLVGCSSYLSSKVRLTDLPLRYPAAVVRSFHPRRSRSSRNKANSKGGSRANPVDSPERLCGDEGQAGNEGSNGDGAASTASSCESSSDSDAGEFQGPLAEYADESDDNLMMALAKTLGGADNGSRSTKKGSRKSKLANETDKLDLAVSGGWCCDGTWPVRRLDRMVDPSALTPHHAFFLREFLEAWPTASTKWLTARALCPQHNCLRELPHELALSFDKMVLNVRTPYYFSFHFHSEKPLNYVWPSFDKIFLVVRNIFLNTYSENFLGEFWPGFDKSVDLPRYLLIVTFHSEKILSIFWTSAPIR